jgi:site-specific DNA-methyltransferase (adenine-specific)
MFKKGNIKIYNADCMGIMKGYEDNYFDLAIVDPPYGIGISGQKEVKKGKKSDRKFHKEKEWDKEIPSKKYFTQLQRVSKNQIIWGANYFVKHLTKGTKGWIVWDKRQYGLTMSDCELAYSSFQKPTRVFLQNRVILQQEGGTIHPTQKPIKLYSWILENYASKDCKIIDTHLGSGSSAIASYYFGCKEFVGIEIDEDYYNESIKRIDEKTNQYKLF